MPQSQEQEQEHHAPSESQTRSRSGHPSWVPKQASPEKARRGGGGGKVVASSGAEDDSDELSSSQRKGNASGEEMDQKDSLIEAMCLEISSLQQALETESTEASAVAEELDKCRADIRAERIRFSELDDELKVCKAAVRSEFARTADLDAQISALSEERSDDSGSEDPRSEILTEAEGSHARSAKIQRLEEALADAEAKLTIFKTEMEERKVENDDLRVENERLREAAKGRDERHATVVEKEAQRTCDLESSLRRRGGETDERVMELDVELGNSLIDAELLKERLAELAAENEELRRREGEHKNFFEGALQRSDKIDDFSECIRGKAEKFDDLAEALERSVTGRLEARRELEVLERSHAAQLERVRASYSAKEREATCANVTIRRLARKNESLMEQLSNQERGTSEESSDYIVALRRIAASGNPEPEALAAEIEETGGGGGDGDECSPGGNSGSPLTTNVHHLFHMVDSLLQSEEVARRRTTAR